MEERQENMDSLSFSENILLSPIKIFGSVTHHLFSSLLDGQKLLLSSCGLHRDWRGLAELARLDVSALAASSRISPTTYVLKLWANAGGTVAHVAAALVQMDRHDVMDDAKEAIEEDFRRVSVGGFAALPPTYRGPPTSLTFADANILTVHDEESVARGGELTHYDALLLHADEDMLFVRKMLEKLEDLYGFKICVKDRDMVGGLQFETEGVVRLIMERCDRVIVVLSHNFLKCAQNTFFTHFAHALSVEHRSRIVIPCRFEPCEKPAVISFCHTLDFFRAAGYWDYWDKLRHSLVSSRGAPPALAHHPAQVTEVGEPCARHQLQHQQQLMRQQQQQQLQQQQQQQQQQHKRGKQSKSEVCSVGGANKKATKCASDSSASSFLSRFRRRSDGKRSLSEQDGAETHVVPEGFSALQHHSNSSNASSDLPSPTESSSSTALEDEFVFSVDGTVGESGSNIGTATFTAPEGNQHLGFSPLSTACSVEPLLDDENKDKGREKTTVKPAEKTGKQSSNANIGSKMATFLKNTKRKRVKVPA